VQEKSTGYERENDDQEQDQQHSVSASKGG